MSKQYQHLPTKEQEILLKILRKFEFFFNGTFGTWKTTPVYLELKDDLKSVCSRPYPVLRVNGAIFNKEVERILKLGVIKEENDSEWGAP